MFKTIKAKVTAYKWIIIISLFAGLGLFSVVQYYQADKLRDRTEVLEEKNETLKTEIVTIKREFVEYKDKVDGAVVALNDLRVVFSSISDDTASLEDRLNLLREQNRNPKPGAPPRNIEQMEQEINQLTHDIFRRIEEASRGTGETK